MSLQMKVWRVKYLIGVWALERSHTHYTARGRKPPLYIKALANWPNYPLSRRWGQK